MKPCLMDTNPEIIFTIEPGTKKGETFLKPFDSKIDLFFSMVSIPPMPAPKFTPTLFRSVDELRIPESSMD